ncbi:MAG: leucine-rich repeat protein [Lachnospiraceae bacterium]|nr:leucine-rich repeat protein [Lachnospiraceae bacterium]
MKKIMSIMLIVCMVLTTLVPVMAEETVATYYVSEMSGDDNNSGTQAAPVKTLVKALGLAEANSIIYIMDDIQVADATNNDAPLIIEKNVTIQGDANNIPTITLRAGGIVLGRDVTFENVKIGTASMLRPGIAANGHTLKLINVYQDESLQPLQIYGGTFFDATNDTVYGESVRGTKSNIEISGGSYEAVYAGSINGDGAMDVDITIAKGFGLEMGGVYAGSTVKDPGDTSTSGQIPQLERELTLQGEINIKIEDNANVKKVCGVNDTNTVNLETDGTGYYSFAVTDVDSVTVNGGIFAPAQGSDLGVVEQYAQGTQDIELVGSTMNKATLDLSELTYTESMACVADFTGSENGILVLPKDTKLQVDGVLTGGPTELRLSGGMPWSSEDSPGYSGWMEYNTIYVNGNDNASSDGTFMVSNPYPTQTDMAFTESSSTVNGWTTVEESAYEPPALIDFAPDDTTVTCENANATLSGVIAIRMNPTFSEDETLYELAYVPIDYQVTYTDVNSNEVEYVKQSSFLDEDGYYYCSYEASTSTTASDVILMKFTPIGEMISIEKGTHDFAAGIYEIAITALTTSGYVTKNCKVTITSSEENPPADVHTHQWETSWSNNEAYHWHECELSDCTTTTDSLKNGYEAHHGGIATCKSKAICVDCGIAYGEKDSNNHTGEAEFRNQKEATETEAGYTGDTYCLGCGEKLKTGTVIPAIGSDTDNGENTNKDDGGTENDTDSENSGQGTEYVTITEGDNVFDSESNVMYVVTKVEATGGTVEYKKLHVNQAMVTIPDTVLIGGKSYKVTSVAAKAFKGNKKLTSVKIGDNVTTIGKEAFSGCKKLKAVTLGKNVVTIDDKAFYNGTALTTITIPSKVSKIGKSAFEQCKKLKTVTIKSKKLTAKKVGTKAFRGIKSNATIKVPKKKYKTYKSMLYKKGVSKKATFKKI